MPGVDLFAVKAPDTNNSLALTLVDKWVKANDDRGPKPTANGSLFRYSQANGCARAIVLEAHASQPDANPDIKPEPFNRNSIWVMGLGTVIHELFQEALTERFGDQAEVEVIVGPPPGEPLSISGHTDAVLKITVTETREHHEYERKRVTVLEVKTVNGTKYKAALKGEPAINAVLQGAMYGVALDADEVIVIYLPMEGVSPAVVKSKGIPEEHRAGLQWTYNRDEFAPLAQAEFVRFRALEAYHARGNVPDRNVPMDNGRTLIVEDTDTGSGVYDGGGKGKTWRCGYCQVRDQCNTLGPGVKPLALLGTDATLNGHVT